MTGARARSPDAKRARRQSILTTAEQILRSDGFDAFTMNSLATTTELAKGTLYLYFSSREELVLALYIDLNDDWVDRFLLAEKAHLPPDYAALCARFYQSFAADALLVDLAGRAASGLEPYVATGAKVAAKAKAKAKRAKARENKGAPAGMGPRAPLGRPMVAPLQSRLRRKKHSTQLQVALITSP